MVTTLAFLNLNPMELVILGCLGILLFGRKLPEIGKNLGKSIVEFKRGLNSAGDEINKASSEDSGSSKPMITSGKPPVKQIAAGTDEP